MRAGIAVLSVLIVSSSGVGVAVAGGPERKPGESAFIAEQSAHQWMASRLLGTTVVGEHNETMGDVSDLLIDNDGRTIGLVIGVGGFLGIGEKAVAVSLSRVQVILPEMRSDKPDSGSRPGPDRVVLHASREELEAAPRFQPAARPALSLPKFGDGRR